MTLPASFIQRMTTLLGAEADAFFAALGQPAATGLRVNTLKLAPDRLVDLSSWPLTPLPWCPAGFHVTNDDQPGKHPYHAAGLYYLQEPSAMTVAEALAPQPGDMALDLAAAPGGKSTHLAALMGDHGLLVANEVEPGRTRGLIENLERWGVRHTIVTNSEPGRLADQWGACFDRVLVDAPCSGEGMFRKSQAALDQWSEKLVQSCALRQHRLLATAGRLVRPGGWLAYSTCTFAPDENEAVIADFLTDHPEFSLRPIPLPGLSPGRPAWVSSSAPDPSLALTARLWPHHVTGDGHFIALLQRTASPLDKRTLPARVNRRTSVKTATRAERQRWQAFVTATLAQDPVENAVLTTVGPYLYALPDTALSLDGLKVVRPGLWLGVLHQDRFEPSHSLALTLRPHETKPHCLLDLDPHDDRLAHYLQGHPLTEPGEPGWVLITVSGFPLGWGRRSQGIVKNAYPKGLRRPPT